MREVDPRASRDLWWLLVLVATLVGGLVLYAWPHLQIRETARAQERMSRERERLLEENRKLRLEKASLENLRRVETIAHARPRACVPPRAASSLVVVERPRPARAGRASWRAGPASPRRRSADDGPRAACTPLDAAAAVRARAHGAPAPHAGRALRLPVGAW